jgi:hypothetical protein
MNPPPERRAPVDRAGNELLAGAGFPFNEDRTVRHRNAARVGSQIVDGLTLANDRRRRIFRSCFCGIRSRAASPLETRRCLNGRDQLVAVHRLGQEIRRAELCRLEGSRRGCRAAHHHDWGRNAIGLQAPQDLASGRPFGKPVVQHDDVVSHPAREREPFRTVQRSVNVEAGVAQKAREDINRSKVIVDNEHP